MRNLSLVGFFGGYLRSKRVLEDKEMQVERRLIPEVGVRKDQNRPAGLSKASLEALTYQADRHGRKTRPERCLHSRLVCLLQHFSTLQELEEG